MKNNAVFKRAFTAALTKGRKSSLTAAEGEQLARDYQKEVAEKIEKHRNEQRSALEKLKHFHVA
jgi:hypothetical protein